MEYPDSANIAWSESLTLKLLAREWGITDAESCQYFKYDAGQHVFSITV